MAVKFEILTVFKGTEQSRVTTNARGKFEVAVLPVLLGDKTFIAFAGQDKETNKLVTMWPMDNQNIAEGRISRLRVYNEPDKTTRLFAEIE